MLAKGMINMKYKGIIFDLDGTLLDTLTDLFNAVNYTLKALNEPLRSLEEVRAFVGNGVPTLLMRSLTDQTKHAQALKIFTPYYNQHKDDHTKAYDQILTLLQSLNQNGYQLGIVSNKIHEATTQLNQKIFMGLIQNVIGAKEEIALKPQADMLLNCLEMMNLKPEEVIYLGDTEVDWQTASNANIDFVAVTWGFRDQEYLETLNPKYIINQPLDLLKILT